jgi:hypothetical protein
MIYNIALKEIKMSENETTITRIPKELEFRAHGIRLYLEDIEQIIEYISNVTSDYIISTKKYRTKNLKELISVEKEPLYYFTVYSTKPYISLYLCESSTSLTVAEESATTRGVFEKIKDILKRRRRIAFIFFNSIFPLFLLLLTSTATGGIISHFITYGFNTILLLFALLLIITYIAIDRISSHRNSIIILKYKSEDNNFLKRNKDIIVVGIFIALLGAILAYIIPKLFG